MSETTTQGPAAPGRRTSTLHDQSHHSLGAGRDEQSARCARTAAGLDSSYALQAGRNEADRRHLCPIGQPPERECRRHPRPISSPAAPAITEEDQ